MPQRMRLTRRFPAAMTERGYRNLKAQAAEAGLEEGEFLSFLFENFNSVTNQDNLLHRLKLLQAEMAKTKD